MTTAILLACGAGMGLGLWLLTVWAVPPRPTLAQILHATTRPPARPPATGGADARIPGMGPILHAMAAVGLPGSARRRDLAVLSGSLSAFVAQKVLLALTGLLIPLAAHLVVLLLGAGLPWQIPTAVSGVCVAGGFLAPDLDVARRATRARAAFRHALAAYLGLVRLCLATGAGPDAALDDAATIGHGDAFHHLRRALYTARFTRTTPWAALDDLGKRFDIPELVSLAHTVSLAGTEGAAIRTSLAAKAATLRTHELTDAESQSQAATERMALPVILLFAAFLLFIGFPAIHAVLTGL